MPPGSLWKEIPSGMRESKVLETVADAMEKKIKEVEKNRKR